MRLHHLTIALITSVLLYACEPPPRPRACFEATNTGAYSVNFDPSCSEMVSPVSWDFGDSSPISSLGSPTHTYRDRGVYKVVLTTEHQSENNDQYSATQMVTVKAYCFTCECIIGAQSTETMHCGTLEEMEQKRNEDPVLSMCNCSEIEFM